jgi:hypothetical protein
MSKDLRNLILTFDGTAYGTSFATNTIKAGFGLSRSVRMVKLSLQPVMIKLSSFGLHIQKLEKSYKCRLSE